MFVDVDTLQHFALIVQVFNAPVLNLHTILGGVDWLYLNFHQISTNMIDPRNTSFDIGASSGLTNTDRFPLLNLSKEPQGPVSVWGSFLHYHFHFFCYPVQQSRAVIHPRWGPGLISINPSPMLSRGVHNAQHLSPAMFQCLHFLGKKVIEWVDV